MDKWAAPSFGTFLFCSLFLTPPKRLVVPFPTSIINATLLAKGMDCGDIVYKWATQVELSQFQIITGSRGFFGDVASSHSLRAGVLQLIIHPVLDGQKGTARL